MSPSAEHERDSQLLVLLVEIVAAVLAIPVQNVGAMTYRRKRLRRGFEPDGSFYIRHEARMRGKQRVDPEVDPPPDLVIEMDVSRSSLDKLALFARLGVPEVWRCEAGRVQIYLLAGSAYEESAVSVALPQLTADVLTLFLAERRTRLSPDWFRVVSEWALAHHAGGDSGR
jgi:Uma2 family endonuclease